MTARVLATCLAAALLAGCGGGERPDAGAGPGREATLPDVPAELRAAVESAPDDAAARRALAIALHEVGRHDEAVEQFERLVETNPTRRPLLDLALAYGSAGRDEQAAATYDRILALSPEDPIALHNLGNIARRRGDDRGAIDYYGRAVAADPGYLLAHYHLGQVLERLERFEPAYRAYERVLQIEPADGEDLLAADDALYHLAVIDLRMGAVERAAAYLAQVIEADPGHPTAHHDYGEALMKLGRREEAVAQFDLHMRLQAERDAAKN